MALLLVVAVFLLPFLIHRGMEQEQAADPAAQEEIALPDSGYTLRILGSDGQVTEMDMNQYLWGVVAAEMPASFEEEALKAQAVAARTYAPEQGPHVQPPRRRPVHRLQLLPGLDRPGGRPEQLGDSAVTYTNKITAAVAETGNQVILYEGQLIDAVFHSSSASATQDAVEVCNSVPYLQSVDSPEGENVPNYQSQATLSSQEFQDLFLEARPEADLSGDPSTWVGDTQYNDGECPHHHHRRGHRHRGPGPADLQPALGGLFRVLRRRHLHLRRHRLRPRGGDEPVRRRRHGRGKQHLHRDSPALLHRGHRGGVPGNSCPSEGEYHTRAGKPWRLPAYPALGGDDCHASPHFDCGG